MTIRKKMREELMPHSIHGIHIDSIMVAASVVRKYGKDRQILQAMEVLLSLVVDLTRLSMLKEKRNKEKTAEGIAEALIMIVQLCIIFGDYGVMAVFNKKIKRLKQSVHNS